MLKKRLLTNKDMTLPDERYRAVASARELLVEMANSSGRWKRIPKELRLYCIHALRHYPTQYDMKAAARQAPDVFQEKMNPLVRILTMYDNEQKENEMKNSYNIDDIKAKHPSLQNIYLIDNIKHKSSTNIINKITNLNNNCNTN